MRQIKRNRLRKAMQILGIEKPNKKLSYFWKHPKEAKKLLKEAGLV